MGLKRRLVDFVASVFVTAPDHPTRGGVTGEGPPGGEQGDGDSDGIQEGDGVSAGDGTGE
jgi:hypothetical protein